MAEQAAPAAATTPATPAAEAAEPITVVTHGLDAVLDQITAEDLEGEQPSAPEVTETEETDPEKPEPDAEPEAEQPDATPDELLFSDEQLGTAEGIKRGRARLLELRKMQHEAYIGLKKYEARVNKKNEKLKRSVDEYVTTKRNDQLLLNNVRSNLQGLHSGDPDSILTALGNLTGQDGIKALELLNSRLVHKGRSPLDPQVQSLIDGLQQKIAQLEGGLNQKQVQEQAAHISQQIAQHGQRIGGIITGSAEQLPHLARLYADDPQGVTEYIIDEIDSAARNGTPVDGSKYFVHLEAQLARRFAPAAPQGEGVGPAPKQPASAPRSPGRSIGPAAAAVSTTRVPTQDESLRALASDTDLMRSLGLG